MSRTAYQASGDVKLEHQKVKWDPKTLEIRTHSVEKALEPLVHQVSWHYKKGFFLIYILITWFCRFGR